MRVVEGKRRNASPRPAVEEHFVALYTSHGGINAYNTNAVYVLVSHGRSMARRRQEKDHHYAEWCAAETGVHVGCDHQLDL